jgi:hypothetical protein
MFCQGREIIMRYVPSTRARVLALSVSLAAALVYGYAVSAGPDNGFDLSNSTLPREQIYHGGPPKDGIPAISDPKMIAPAEADYLEPADRVLGIEFGGEARAYPIPILNWHEIVNDEIDGRRFAVTFCPLCGTGVAFEANIDGENTDFGVSGLLYNSDVLLYDRATESLWSQILGEAIAGERVGKRLVSIPITHTTWGAWLELHPRTLVMSDETGHFRDYGRNPYAGYEQSRDTYFAVNNAAPDNYHPKEVVAGLEHGGVYKAYPFVELDRYGKPEFSDTVGGKRFDFRWDAQNRSLAIVDEEGRPVAAIQRFSFAWFAFHPDTEVFTAKGS